MNTEKARILQLVKDGKVDVDEGLELLEALENSTTSKVTSPTGLADRFLRVRINGATAKKVNVNIPISLVKAASRFAAMGMGFIPKEARDEMKAKGVDLSAIDLEELVNLIDQGLVDGKLVDIDVDDPEEGPVKVEVYVD